MIKPEILKPGDEATVVGKIFSTPLVVKGKSWLPLAEIFAIPALSWAAKNRHPGRTWMQCFRIALLSMPVMLGSEWCHNLAHTAAAKMVGKPVDAIRIMFGMPLLVYHDINDERVTPRQHIIRGLGGPIFNALALSIAMLIKPLTKPKSIARDVVDTAYGTNLFLLAVGMLPIPGIDGGAVLKWVLVERGQNIPQADQTVQKVNGALSAGLAAGAVAAVKKRRLVLGGFLGLMAMTSLAVGLGLLKEQT